jgi:hypothetical protein
LTVNGCQSPFVDGCAENDESILCPLAKIQDGSTTLIERMHLKYLGGIYLDVFPIDGDAERMVGTEVAFW